MAPTSLPPVSLTSVEHCTPINWESKCSMLNLLPNKMDLIGQWLNNEDLKVATMVCKLLQDIFFLIYLKCNKFSPHQSFISLKGLSSYWAFKYYHCFPHPPWQAYLSAFLAWMQTWMASVVDKRKELKWMLTRYSDPLLDRQPITIFGFKLHWELFHLSWYYHHPHRLCLYLTSIIDLIYIN